MKTILLIAADGIRGLIHQRLLLGLMLASLAMTIVFSVFLNSVRQNVTESFSEDRIASDSFKGSEKMSEADRRKLREQMGNMSSVFRRQNRRVVHFQYRGCLRDQKRHDSANAFQACLANAIPAGQVSGRGGRHGQLRPHRRRGDCRVCSVAKPGFESRDQMVSMAYVL